MPFVAPAARPSDVDVRAKRGFYGEFDVRWGRRSLCSLRRVAASAHPQGTSCSMASEHQRSEPSRPQRAVGRRRLIAMAAAAASVPSALALRPAASNASPASALLAPVAPAAPAEPSPSFFGNMLSSAVARAVALSAVHPVDTVKTKVQTSRKKGRTAVEAFRHIVSRDGPKGFYRGVDSALVGQVPYAAIAFSVYETLKSALIPLCPPELHVPCLLLCGSLGDLTGSVIVVPSEVVKTRLQNGVYQSAPEAVSAIFGMSGVRGFYQGYTIQIFRDVPFRAIQVTCFETLKTLPLLAFAHENTLLLGMLAGAFAAALTTPLDVAKTRLMAQDPHAAPPTPVVEGNSRPSAAYAGPVDALVRIAGEEGPGALLRGIGPRVLVIAPMSSIFFAVYEALRALLAS